MAVIPASLPAFLDDSPPFTDDELDDLFAWLDSSSDGPPDSVPASKPDRWSVTDDRSAEWAMRMYVAVDVVIAKLEDDAEVYIAQVRAWLDRATKPLKRRRQFFSGHITDYALRRRHEDPDFKTLKLPSGDVPTRLVPSRPEILDSDHFVAWARLHAPGTVKARWSPVVAEVKKAVTFATVRVHDTLGRSDVVVRQQGTDQLIAVVPDLPAIPVSRMTEDFHDEVLPLYPVGDHFIVVPAVDEIPETISASIRPAGGK